MKMVLVALAAVLLLAACSSAERTTSTATSTATPNDPSTVTDNPTSDLSPGTAQVIVYDDAGKTGAFTITIGKSYAVADSWLGVAVTISQVTGTPVLDYVDFAAGPVKQPDYSDKAAGADIGDNAVTRAACKGVEFLSAALHRAGMSHQSSDDGAGMTLISNGNTANGCVTIPLTSADHPTTIGYNLDAYASDGGPTWSLTMPRHEIAVPWPRQSQSVQAPRPSTPPSGIVYGVTSDGAIDNVAYITANFGQEQDTNVPGSTWSKKIPRAGVQTPIITAQAGAGATSITCTITVDGVQITKQSSHGQYAVVTCTAPS